MTTPTQNQNQNQNQKQNPQDKQQAQAGKDDMHNTGAQAQDNRPQAANKDADRDVQQRKDAPKPGQNH